MATSVMTAKELKEKGNEEFKNGNWSEALIYYTNAIKLVKDNNEKGPYYKSRAAAYVKLRNYDEAIEDCDSALKMCCNKALYRRCQALEALERFEEACRDAEVIISSDPNNKVLQSVATRLLKIVKERRKENVSQMMDLAFNTSADRKKRETAMSNLLDLARQEAGAEEIFKKEGVSKIAQLVKVEKNERVMCSAIRIIGELCKNNISRTESVMKYVGLPWCLEIINSTSTEKVNASQYCLQNILNTYSGMNNKADSKPDNAMCEVHKKEIDTILSWSLNSVTSRAITNLARDAIIEFIMNNIYCVTAFNWTERFIELRGLQRLMEVASETGEYKYESSMDITSSTQIITGVCLARIYEILYYAKNKTKIFVNVIDKFIEDKLLSSDIESKVRVVVAITTLLLSPLNVGDAVIFKKEIGKIILTMAETDDLLQQKVVCECLVAAVTKYKEANLYICQSVNILEKLYQSKDDSIRIRALVGLCKLSKFEDTRCNLTIDPFANGATKTLVKVCRRFLINPKKENDMRKWAIKGLSYLTCGDKAKEMLLEDQEALKAIFELTKTDDQSILYDVLMTLVNLCNAYDDQENIPEMTELRQFTEQYFSDNEYELDIDDFQKRYSALTKAGVTSALIKLAKTDNQNNRELIARAFNTICNHKELNEIEIQQGGTKTLLSLALDNTEKGKSSASMALVNVGLKFKFHPEVAFPGQMIMEVVRPIMNLLKREKCFCNENVIIITVLCALAQANDNVREHMFKEGVLQKIEPFIHEEDYFLKFTSLSVIKNLVSSHEVAVQYFEQDNSRVKHLLSLCKDKSENICAPAASILKVVMTANKEAGKIVFDSDSWLESIRFLLTRPNSGIQKCGILIVINIMRSSEDIAAKLMKTDIKKLLRSLTKNNVENEIKQLASLALNAGEISSREECMKELLNMFCSFMTNMTDMTAQECKEKGNEEFNKGNWSVALNCYTNALKLAHDHTEKASYYKNRAAAYLKLCNYEKVVEDCDSAIKRCCNKTLYRRCQALKALERFEEAYRDAKIIISSDPNNKVVQFVATRLLEIVQEDTHISAKVSQMMDLAFNVSADNEKREISMNSLLVLVRQRAGAEEIFKKEGVAKIAQLVKVEKNEGVMCSAIRIVAELCKNNICRTEFVMKYVDLPWCLEIINSTSIEKVNASEYCLQNILNTYSGMNDKPDSKPDKALCEVHKKEIDTILSWLLNNVTNRAITGLARDAVIKLIMRNIHCITALDWAERFVELHGLQRLMEVASETGEYKNESSMDITFSTQAITSVCLTKVYENLYYDAAKEEFSNAIDEFIKEKLLLSNTESKVRTVLAITTLILGPLDIADAIIFKEGMVEMILAMAQTDDILQQKVACECIVAAATKYNEANVFICRGINILEKLYQSKDDSIRVRALVGLCKLNRFEENSLRGHTTIDPFTDSVIMSLAKICRRYLISSKKEETKIWAIRGLSYLTLDAKVKEKFIHDQRSFNCVVQAMIELAKTDDQSVLYAVLTTLVNFCNAYDDEELVPEMKELLLFAKCQHFFLRHWVLNHGFFVDNRRCALANTGVTSALMNLAKTDSKNCKELVARVFNAICSQDEFRGMVVEQGGTKTLLSLALDGTDKGKKNASRALVHLGLTIDVEVAFPGQMLVEVVRPIVNLLNLECTFQENSSTLLVLCDLARVNDNLRGHIFKEGIIQKLEAFMHEKNALRCGCLTLLSILLLSREVATQYFAQDNSRVKHLVLLCKDDDQETRSVAAAALAALTNDNKKACEKVYDSDSWLESLRLLLTDPDCDVLERGLAIVISMIKSTKDVAAKLIETDIMDLLRELNKNASVQTRKIKEFLEIALDDAADRTGREERREAILNMIRLECDRARRSGQLDLVERWQSELWIFENLEYIPLDVNLEFARVKARVLEKKRKK